MTTYHINEHDEVVPASGGRVSNDTRSFRDATELELSQREEIAELEKEVERLNGIIEDGEEEKLNKCEFCNEPPLTQSEKEWKRDNLD